MFYSIIYCCVCCLSAKTPGFAHAFRLANNCPDIHLSCSPTSTHPRLPSYSPTKHHPVLPAVMGFWIGLSDGEGAGSFIRFGETFSTLSNCEAALGSTCFRLASFNMEPTDWSDPSATSTPVLATSPTTSAVLFKTLPVVYPKIDNT